MTSLIEAIGVRIGWAAALMANGDDIRGNAFAATFVKNKVFTNELIFDAFFFAVVGVFNDAAF